MQVRAGSPDRSPATETAAPQSADAAAAATAVRPASPRRGGRRLAVVLGALIALVALAVAAYLLFLRDDDGASDDSTSRAPAAAASLAQLNALATATDHPVYWAGARAGTTYELSQTADGRVFIRYLPSGTDVGTADPNYLAIGTYPQRDALATLTATARAQSVATVRLPGGGRAFQDARQPTSAYLARPGADVQVEVFDPQPGRALELIRSGRVAAFQALPPAAAAPRAVTPAQLRAAAASTGQPVYWAGARTDTTYELTQTRDGRTYVRYLPPGAAVDNADPDYLTVGSYPQADALQTLEAEAARSGAGTFAVAGGGRAFVDEQHPNSVYVAFPGAGVQVEVYDADAARARRLVAGGQLRPVG